MQRRRPIGEMFTVHPVAADYVALPAGETVLAALVQAVRRGVPLVVLTGGAGTGKSMLATMTMASLKPEVPHIAYLSSAADSEADIFCSLALASGMPLARLNDQPAKDWLLRALIERKLRDEPSLLVLDEAQHLTAEAWFELLGWHQWLWRKGLRLHLLAVGLPALLARMAEPCLSAPLAQPPLALCLASLDGSATREFIGVTLRRSGRWGCPVLEEAALDEVYRRTGGVPGRIQRLVGRCLQTAEIFSLPVIDADTVAQQADELGLRRVLDARLDAAAIAPIPHPQGWPAAAAQAEPPSGELIDTPPGPSTGLPAAPGQAQAPLPPVALPHAPAARQRPPRLPAGGWRWATAALAMLVLVVGMAAWYGPAGVQPSPQLQAAAPTDQASVGSDPALASSPMPMPTPPPSQDVSPPSEPSLAGAAAVEAAPRPAVAARAGLPVAQSLPKPPPVVPPQRVAAQAIAPSPACSLILARFSLGEPLSASDRATLSTQCR